MGRLLKFLQKKAESFVTAVTSFSHPKSIQRLFAQSFGVLTVIFILLFLVSTLTFSNIMQDQIIDSMKDTMELYNDQISQSFNEALTYLSESCIESTDISMLNATKNESDIYLYTARIKKTLSAGICALYDIGGLFVYSQKQNVFIPQVNDSWNNDLNNLNCSRLIQSLLTLSRERGELSELDLSKWFLLEDGNDYFLARIIYIRDTYMGAWINLERISSTFRSFEDMGAAMLYVDEEGACIGNPDFSDIRLEPQKSVGKPAYYREGLFPKYLTISRKLDDCDYYIMALIPVSYTFRRLAPLYWLMLFILLLLLAFSIALVSVMGHFFHAPSKILQPTIAAMRSGQFDSKIEVDSQFTEIQNITGTFNDMITEIQSLRIHIYEEQLAKKDLELQYLKSQVAPHFLINCLNTLFVLAQDKANLETTQRLVQTLSEHLRYTMAERTTISLEEELYYVENYLSLTQIRFPGTLTWEISVDPELRDTQVFPLMLLTLTENSIKANVVMGESFQVRIDGSCYEEEGQTRVHLAHTDSGRGFDKDSLYLYNHIEEHPELHQNGYSIGIYNTVMRLHLTLGDSATILFSNEPGWGARVDLDFPYVPEEELT